MESSSNLLAAAFLGQCFLLHGPLAGQGWARAAQAERRGRRVYRRAGYHPIATARHCLVPMIPVMNAMARTGSRGGRGIGTRGLARARSGLGAQPQAGW
jgi:hypothetical protein